MSPRRRFQDRWLSNENFKPWLARVEDSNAKAYCKICKKILSAEISSLKRHRISKYHQDQGKNKTEKPTRSESDGLPPAENSDRSQSFHAVTYATILMVVFIAEHNLPMRYELRKQIFFLLC